MPIWWEAPGWPGGRCSSSFFLDWGPGSQHVPRQWKGNYTTDTGFKYHYYSWESVGIAGRIFNVRIVNHDQRLPTDQKQVISIVRPSLLALNLMPSIKTQLSPSLCLKLVWPPIHNVRSVLAVRTLHTCQPGVQAAFQIPLGNKMQWFCEQWHNGKHCLSQQVFTLKGQAFAWPVHVPWKPCPMEGSSWRISQTGAYNEFTEHIPVALHESAHSKSMMPHTQTSQHLCFLQKVWWNTIYQLYPGDDEGCPWTIAHV